MQDVINKLLKYFKVPAQARNDAGERIESMRFSVPALRVGVLEYGPGQLQTGNAALDGKPVKLYYPPEAVSDDKFLKSLETAPVIVGGHDSTTNEQNKKIDGWAHSVHFDEAANAAMIAGVVKGAKEVAYIKGNLGSAGFGASAFVDIYDLKVENGVTPDGQEYNAVANELRATHVALAPHVRDPENKIKVINAVCINTGGEMVVENGLSGNGMKIKVVYEDGSAREVEISPAPEEHFIKELYPVGKEQLSKAGNYSKIKSVKILNARNAKSFKDQMDDTDVVYWKSLLASIKSGRTRAADYENGLSDARAIQILEEKIKSAKSIVGDGWGKNTISIDPAAFSAAVKNAVRAAVVKNNYTPKNTKYKVVGDTVWFEDDNYRIPLASFSGKNR